MSLLEKAADMGNADARLTLAQACLSGIPGFEADREKGIALLREAVAEISPSPSGEPARGGYAGCDGDAEMALAEAIYWKTPPTDAEVLWDAATVLWRDRADYAVAQRLMGRAARMSFVPAMRDYAQTLREDAPKMERERAESKGSRADRRSSARAANAAKWTQGAAIGCEKDPHLAAEIEWQADELSKGKEEPMK